MCIVGSAPAAAPAQIIDPTNRAAAAAADAAQLRRKSAQGYNSSLMGGLSGSQPSIARQMLGLG